MLAPTYADPAKKDNSSYFAHVQKTLIRMYGEKKGVRLANRWWEIRHKTDHVLQQEKTAIIMGLA